MGGQFVHNKTNNFSIHFLLTTRKFVAVKEGGGYCGSSYSIDMRMS